MVPVCGVLEDSPKYVLEKWLHVEGFVSEHSLLNYHTVTRHGGQICSIKAVASSFVGMSTIVNGSQSRGKFINVSVPNSQLKGLQGAGDLAQW